MLQIYVAIGEKTARRGGKGGFGLTKKELSQLFYLNKEIEMEKNRLKELEEAATDTSVKISGLPHTSGISNKTALAAEIADTKTLIEAKEKEAIAEYNRLTRYICTVEDSLIRQILRYRYIDGKSWLEVANTIGGNNTMDGVRMIAYRYIDKK